MLGARKFGEHGMSAGGDQNGFRRRSLSRPAISIVFRSFSVARARNGFDTGFFQRTGVKTVEAIDLALHVADQRRPVEAQILEAPSECAGILESGEYLLP